MNWIKKEDSTICCLQEAHLTNRNKHRLRMKGWKKIYQANGPRKQAGVEILISDKVDFKPTLIKRDKEGHSIRIKGEIDQKEITIINLYVPNFIKHILKDPKTNINSNTVVAGDFNTPLLSIARSPKKKINKEILDLKHNIDQMDLVDVYRTFHPTSTRCTFFTAAHETFPQNRSYPRAQSKPQQI
jgi:hypothetical protein